MPEGISDSSSSRSPRRPPLLAQPSEREARERPTPSARVGQPAASPRPAKPRTPPGTARRGTALAETHRRLGCHPGRAAPGRCRARRAGDRSRRARSRTQRPSRGAAHPARRSLPFGPDASARCSQSGRPGASRPPADLPQPPGRSTPRPAGCDRRTRRRTRRQPARATRAAPAPRLPLPSAAPSWPSRSPNAIGSRPGGTPRRERAPWALEQDREAAEQRLEAIRQSWHGSNAPALHRHRPNPGRTSVAGGRRASATFGNGNGVHRNGLLIRATEGTPVTAVQRRTRGLRRVDARFRQPADRRPRDQVMTLYAHLQHFEASVGEALSRGDSLGAVGVSGGQRQPALYFEVRREGKPIDPRHGSPSGDAGPFLQA
ncbi:hypothetical protein DSL92_02580 [Billgrantia gudaonensis]|uniref:M23ase beta-sheet core domain-containing protein n=1 Tax=Billgrantia gudaonensis TaxID=376427 RepID=A0A3S0VT37_9GAMM|nr:hypothetical protein DSL92_02580 [Halomonas gudaonensis]